MDTDDWKQRIVADPEVLVGKPRVRGTRLSVEFIVGRLADGWTFEELLENYPHLTRDDILACLKYVSEMLEDFRAYPLSRGA